MKFFTKEWLRAELSDEAFEAVPADYQRHVAELRLPTDVEALANINVHDAWVLRARFDSSAKQFSLRLRCGDLQRGYSDCAIEYSGAVVDDEGLANLRRAMTEPHDEVLYDEIDRFRDNFEHRLILASHREARVVFNSVEVVPMQRGETNVR